MIKVYICDEAGEQEGFLGHFAPSEISQLSELFERWPTITDSGDINETICDRFVIRDGRAFFEIVVGGN